MERIPRGPRRSTSSGTSRSTTRNATSSFSQRHARRCWSPSTPDGRPRASFHSTKAAKAHRWPELPGDDLVRPYLQDGGLALTPGVPPIVDEPVEQDLKQPQVLLPSLEDRALPFDHHALVRAINVDPER